MKNSMRGLAAMLAIAAAWALPAMGEKGPLFQDVDADQAALSAGERMITPVAARIVRLDREGLAAQLAAAPAELAQPRGVAGIELVLPLPRGGEARYRIVDSPIMAPELAASYPEFRTFRLLDVDHPGYGGRGDWTLHGFHAVVRTPEGMFYIDPLWRGDTEIYQSYLRSDLRASGEPFHCAVDGQTLLTPEDVAELEHHPEPVMGGLDLRTYRLALAATGEYTTFHGGTVPLAMAAIVTAVNRVNEVYERDVAIRMILVANNSSVVYTNGATDPYTNNNGGTMLGQNTTNLNNVIGSANYDIGHVFSTGGGGVATLGGPCLNGKARGVTGLTSPTGDAFYIDYVAHEMGHQWGGNHTFNGSVSNCSGGNRNAETAYEPGSGSTIMAYAGICSPQNLQSNSDPYFHRVSIDEIQDFSRNTVSCHQTIAVGNIAPTVDAGAAFNIPISTPFALTGSGADSDGVGALDYCWEEWDLGPTGAPTTPTGNAAIFRSFNPTTNPTRTFPKLSDLLNNTSTIGEILPTYARTMNFRLTVRDNDLPAGANSFDGTSVVVNAGAGPFLVTDPNTAITWNGPGPHSVAWNVANTTAAPINCAAVNILLSTDGGNTFPITLASAVANDGSESVIVGAPDTTTARVKVICNGNIFFDLSNANFTITGASGIFADGFEAGNTAAWADTVP